MTPITRSNPQRPRIAWCSATLFPPVYRHHGKQVNLSCPWKVMLFEEARRAIDADWLVLSYGPHGLACDFEEDGVRHVVLGRRRRLQNWNYDWRGFREAGAILEAWQPSLVHVHGSENYFGLLPSRGIVRAPTVIALQGLLKPYVRTVWGALSRAEVRRIDLLRERVRGTGLFGLARQWEMGAVLETEILRGRHWFVGRTAWDRANLHAVNPSASYRTLHELLRPEFAASRWGVKTMKRHSVFFGNLSGPHKGGDVLVEAMRILKQTVPDVRLRVAGNMNAGGGYAGHLSKAIQRAGLAGDVDFLGYLDGLQMADELARSHVFASASYMDNSPNAVGEAMMVGVPSVCSFVGGLPSIGCDGEHLLFFPSGDPEALAAAIARIFSDDDLAGSLSLAARRRARSLHDAGTVRSELTALYGEMLAEDRDQVLLNPSLNKKFGVS